MNPALVSVKFAWLLCQIFHVKAVAYLAFYLSAVLPFISLLALNEAEHLVVRIDIDFPRRYCFIIRHQTKTNSYAHYQLPACRLPVKALLMSFLAGKTMNFKPFYLDLRAEEEARIVESNKRTFWLNKHLERWGYHCFPADRYAVPAHPVELAITVASGTRWWKLRWCQFLQWRVADKPTTAVKLDITGSSNSIQKRQNGAIINGVGVGWIVFRKGGAGAPAQPRNPGRAGFQIKQFFGPEDMVPFGKMTLCGIGK